MIRTTLARGRFGRGQTLVEFALTLPVILLLLFAAIDTARAERCVPPALPSERHSSVPWSPGWLSSDAWMTMSPRYRPQRYVDTSSRSSGPMFLTIRGPAPVPSERHSSRPWLPSWTGIEESSTALREYTALAAAALGR